MKRRKERMNENNEEVSKEIRRNQKCKEEKRRGKQV